MNGPREQKSTLGVDDFLILFGAVVLAFSLYLFFNDDVFSKSTQGKMKPVGQIALSQKDVRRRMQSGLNWSSIESSDMVFEGDSIFTGDASEAAVDLKNGSHLKIDSKSLIVIRTMGNQPQLDLQYGSLSGHVAAGQPIAFVRNGRLQEISSDDNAEIRINSVGPDGEAKIQVLKGEVQIKSSSLSTSGQKDKPTLSAVRENEVMEINPRQTVPTVKRQSVEPISPANGKTLWLAPGHPLAFAWRQIDQSDTYNVNIFEIAADPNFSSRLLSEETRGARIQIPGEKLPIGPVHWRVLPRDPVAASRIQPAVAKFIHYPDLPPLPKFPEDQQEFASDVSSESKSKQIEMMWEDKSGSTSFDVELARDENFADVIASKSVTQNNHLTPALPEGEYFWRVRGTHPERANPPWSRVTRFKIGPEAVAPEIPRLTRKWINYQIPNSVLDRAPAGVSVDGQGVAPENLEPFRWSEVKDAEGYEVEIASTDAFMNAIKHPVGKEFVFAPQEVKPGSLYVRVRAVGRNGLMSPPSETGRLDVTLPAPQLKPVKSETAKFKTQDELEKDTHNFDLSWNTRPFAESYELEWASDPTFQQSKKFRLKNNKRAIAVSKPSSYAARVRALGPGGVPISPFSSVMLASYKKELDTGVIAATPNPAGQKTPASIDPTQSALGKGFGNGPKLQEPPRNTSFVALEGSVPFVNFRWRPIPSASSYEVQIAQDADFVNVVTTVKASSTRYTLKAELPEGRVFWRVRAIVSNQPTEWSDVHDIKVLYQ